MNSSSCDAGNITNVLSFLNMLAASFEVDLKNHSCIYTFMISSAVCNCSG